MSYHHVHKTNSTRNPTGGFGRVFFRHVQTNLYPEPPSSDLAMLLGFWGLCGAAVGVMYALCVFVGYWCVGPSAVVPPPQLLPVYNLLCACLFFVQAVLAFPVVGSNDSVVGIGSTNPTPELVWVHAGSYCTLLVDSAIILYTYTRERLRFRRVFQTTTVYALWGTVAEQMRDQGSVRALVLTSALMMTADYLYYATVDWCGRGACRRCGRAGYRVLWGGVSVITAATLLARTAQHRVLLAAVVVHSCVMLTIDMHALWQFRRTRSVGAVPEIDEAAEGVEEAEI
jgi:hypothetical protein